jgi:drug/metabolite transporter (DMT)-like permease
MAQNQATPPKRRPQPSKPQVDLVITAVVVLTAVLVLGCVLFAFFVPNPSPSQTQLLDWLEKLSWTGFVGLIGYGLGSRRGR